MTPHLRESPLARRLNSFRAAGLDVPAAIRAVAAVPGISALELNFPQHFARLTEAALASLLAETGLRLIGLNLRFEGAVFADGAFTSPRAETRERAIRLAQDAVELARRQGADHVVLWLADDGVDYPFQVDYGRLWTDAIDGFQRLPRYLPLSGL